LERDATGKLKTAKVIQGDPEGNLKAEHAAPRMKPAEESAKQKRDIRTAPPDS
jgi:hypothetical protein